MRFTIEELNDYLDDPVIEERHGKRRWSEAVTCVFKADDGKHYKVDYEEGNTEYQEYYGEDRYPDSYREDGYVFVDCPEVELYEELVPVVKYRVLPA